MGGFFNIYSKKYKSKVKAITISKSNNMILLLNDFKEGLNEKVT